MQILEKKIKNVGLVIEQKVNFKELNIYITNYIYNNNNIIGKYILVYCDAKQFETNVFENDEFINEVIQPIFFKCQNDLNWNLYLTCILEEEEYNNVIDSKKVQFQINKEYTRNIIVTMKEFEEIIPIGKIVLPIQKSIIEPIEAWREQLKTYNLEFCLNTFATYIGESYLSNRGISSDLQDSCQNQRNEKNNSENIYRVEGIDKLKLTDSYRKGCFGVKAEIGFGKANLLTGANGSGKTSILEAIELAMTGEVRKSNKKGALGSNEVDTEIELIVNDGLSIKIPEDAREKKKRESWWYKRSSEDVRSGPMLNDSFHRYNQFTVEDTVIFSYIKEDKVVNKSHLTKVLFGESTNFSYENINRYKKWFGGKIKELGQQLDIHKQYLCAYEVKNISKDEINNYVENTYLRKNTLANLEDYKKELIQLQMRCSAMKDLSRFRNEKDIQKEFQIIEEQLKDLTQQIGELDIKKEQVKQLRYSIIQREDNFKEQQKSIKSKTIKLEELVEAKIILRAIKDNIDIIMEFKELDKTKEELTRLVNENTEFFYRYKELGELEEDYLSIANKVEMYHRDYKVLESIKQKIHVTQEQIKSKINENKMVEDIILTIRHYGEKYVEQTKEVNECPLCGNNITKEKLIDSIERKIDRDDNQIVELQKTLGEIEKEESIFRNKVEANQEYISLLNSIDRAYMEADFGQGNIAYESDKLGFIKKVINKYEQNLSILQELNNSILMKKKLYSERLKEIEKYDLFDTYCIKMERISKLLGVITEESIDIKDMATEFIKKIDKLEKLFQEKTSEIEKQLLDVEKQKEKVHNEILNIEEDKEKLYGLVNSKNNQKAMLIRGIEFFMNIKEKLKEDVKDVNIVELENHCKSIVEMIDLLRNDEKNRNEISKTNRQIEEIKKKLYVANKAYQCLDNIVPLEKYGEDFIKDNITHISKVFKLLHSPREFDELRLNEDGDLVGIKDMEEVALNKMSTGQRTAVVLSVFFNMNAILREAPNFILIDEPVANIDDMNILSLLDFLREMVISNNKQIFFTTANYNVGKLFRRKFSFMEKEFTELVFDRNSKLPTRITQNYYDITKKVKEEVIDFNIIR